MAQERPDIEYPCNWEFRIIEADEAGLRKPLPALWATRTTKSALDTPKAWISIHLTMWVLDEEHRNTVYRMLLKHPLVKMIL